VRVTLCVDALAPNPGGIGRYTWELCKGLAGREEISSLHYVAHGRLIDDPQRLLRGERLPRARGPFRILAQRKLQQLLSSSLVHGPNYFLPPLADAGVITVHDLSVLRYPEAHPAERVRAFEKQLVPSIERSLRIITDTETMRREVIGTFAVDPERVTAVPLGVDSRFRPAGPEEIASVIGQWSLAPGGYGLCVSTLEPRKKIPELIHAWRKLPRALRDRFPLVLAGGSGWKNETLLEEIESAAAEGWLVNLGFVDDAVLPELYAGAALFAYPSTYEGFGLPPLEAMASGVPVIVANKSCLPEVCEDAARYVSPYYDDDGFAEAIREILCDADLRSDMVRRGLARAEQFTWDRCIEGTVAVYRSVTGAS
jgi:alpha-1,3-rhamnosyl/mannosyltransferase